MTQGFHASIAIRWKDFDALGHVNHAVYLTYFEEARDAFLQSILANPEAMYVVRKIEVEYLVEIPAGIRSATIHVHAVRVGNTSFVTSERLLLPDGTLAAMATTTNVWWDIATHAPKPLSEGERARLEATAP